MPIEKPEIWPHQFALEIEEAFHFEVESEPNETTVAKEGVRLGNAAFPISQLGTPSPETLRGKLRAPAGVWRITFLYRAPLAGAWGGV